MKLSYKKIIILITGLFIIGGFVFRARLHIIFDELSQPSLPQEVSAAAIPAKSPAIPAQYNISVPFQPQAPFGNWGLPYQEACEEASLIMANAAFKNKKLSPKEMDEEIKKLVAWEKKRFGYYEDTTAAEIAIIAKEYFKLNAQVDFTVTVDNIKKHLSQNHLILVPAAGRILPNPYFHRPGPLYHALIIRGYTSTRFITNDPGTKRGQGFLYKYNDLIKAVHNWPASAIPLRRGFGGLEATAGVPPSPTGGIKSDVTESEMLKGKPVMIILKK